LWLLARHWSDGAADGTVESEPVAVVGAEPR
jgi:hypothetical protein